MAFIPARLCIATVLGACFLLLSSTASAEPYSTLVPATRTLAGVPIPLCCCVTLDNFHYSAAAQSLLATSAVTSGLDPKCSSVNATEAGCVPTVCPSLTVTEVPIGVALLAPKLGSFAMDGNRRKLLDIGTALFQSGEYVYGYAASLIAGSKDYVSFASAVNITSNHFDVQVAGNSLTVQIGIP